VLLVKSKAVWQVLCFVRTKHGASRLARQLEKDGLATSAIHGDKTQAARLEALSQFKEGKLQVLVATDVAARGLDIDDMPLVVNYELPHVPEDYIHRIGRTGRAGATGEAISFVAPEEEKYLAEIEKLLKKKVTILSAEGFDTTSIVRERPPRSTPAERSRSTTSERPPRERGRAEGRREETPTSTHRGDRAPTSDRQRHTASASTGDTRRAEREAAYAKNPDQPLVKRAQPAAGAAEAHPHAHMHAARRTKPVPALLQKRRTPEPEKV
jgi:ATP-dependent RNA helicase RhlE